MRVIWDLVRCDIRRAELELSFYPLRSGALREVRSSFYWDMLIVLNCLLNDF